MVENKMLEFYPYKIFNKNDKSYLYASKTGGLYLIDDNVKKILDFDGKKYAEAEEYFENAGLKNEFVDAINTFEKKAVIKTEENLEKLLKAPIVKRNISSITLMIIQDCNLRCKYCYGGDGQYSERGLMSLDVAKKSVDFLMENSTKDNVSVVFFGGEPLVNYQLIKDVVAYSKDQEKKYNKKVYYSMTTNATLVTDEIAQYLHDNKFTLTISIDGDEETHNMSRYYANKKGSYKDVVRGINILKEHNVPIVARGTVSPENMNLTNSVEHLISLDFNSLFLSEALNLFSKEEDFEKLSNQYGEMIQQYREYLENEDYNKLVKNRAVKKIFDRLTTVGIRNKFCGAMLNTITIDKSGNIYPCHRFVANKEYKMGNVFTGIPEDKFNKFVEKDLRLSKREKCFSCWAYNICGGGCPNENLIATGKCNDPAENKCKVFKKYVEQAIDLYLEMTDEQKVKLLKKKKKAVNE